MMQFYDMSIRCRQYDGKYAVWALMPDPTLTAEERATIRVSSFSRAPKNMTPPLRWVIVGVHDTEEEVYDRLNAKPVRH